MALHGDEHVLTVLGEPGLLGASGLRGFTYAAQQEDVLAVLRRRQRLYCLGATAARRQRVEQMARQCVITRVHPVVCFRRRASRSACMVSRM